MHPGRQLQNRLTALAIAAGLLISGCASDRYVGSVGARGAYGNRGYGLALDLRRGNLDARWQVIDPRSPGEHDPALVPAMLDVPIDLNGDGTLSMDETTRHHRPTVRLLARTASTSSTATSSTAVVIPRIDLDVAILGGAAAARPLELVTRQAAAELVGAQATVGEPTKRTVAPDYQARITEGSTGDGQFMLAVIDQPDFYATESAATRRQVVRVLLLAPQLTPPLREDFRTLLGAITLNARGAPTTSQEQW